MLGTCSEVSVAGENRLGLTSGGLTEKADAENGDHDESGDASDDEDVFDYGFHVEGVTPDGVTDYCERCVLSSPSGFEFPKRAPTNQPSKESDKPATPVPKTDNIGTNSPLPLTRDVQ